MHAYVLEIVNKDFIVKVRKIKMSISNYYLALQKLVKSYLHFIYQKCYGTAHRLLNL